MKEKKDVLLISNPHARYAPLGAEETEKLKKLLSERTDGKIWTADFEDFFNNVRKLENPQASEYSTTENGQWVRYSNNLYLESNVGLLEPNFRLLKNLGAVVEIVNGCPQEDGKLEYEPLLTIPPVLQIGRCLCRPHWDSKFNTNHYLTTFNKEKAEGNLVNFDGNEVASIKSLEDIANFVTGMLINNAAIQERAQERLKKLEEDYEKLTIQWESK